jgi:heterodisulfide reductase subunit D
MNATKESFFQGLNQESLVCAQCGYCQSVCPVLNILGWESSGPRAHMATARLLGSEQKYSPEHVKRVYQCTLCGHCREICPTHIDNVAVWLKMRETFAGNGDIASWPLADMGKNLAKTFNILGEPGENRTLWQQNLQTPLDGLNNTAGVDMVYFVGCVGGLYPRAQSIPAAISELLAQAGVRFTTMGGEEMCCGFPLLGIGLRDQAIEFARKNVAMVRQLGAKSMVFSCPSCFHIWRDVYPELLGEPLGLELMHSTQFLFWATSQNRLQLRPLNKRITYHDPCDLGRNSGVYEVPRDAIRAIPGVELVEMENNRANALCCGGGGNLEAVDKQLSEAIADRRILQAKDTGASILITPCQQCKRTLSGAAKRQKVTINVLDLVELYTRQVEFE